MNKTIPLDLFSSIDSIYERMGHNYSFAFPDNSFSQSRAHPVLSRFDVFSNFLKLVLKKDYVTTENSFQEVYLNQIVENVKIIIYDKDWAYPEGKLNENRGLAAINCIDSSLKNYKSSIKLLGEHCLKNNVVSFDLIRFINDVSCLNYYKYAYPNNYYSEDKAHNTFQMLLALTDSLSLVLNTVITDDKELNDIISNVNDKLKESKKYLNQAYPDNNFDKSSGHECLSKFLKSWTSFKEFSLISLKNYFEKQELITDYENKLNSLSQITVDHKEKNESEEQLTNTQLPVIKKIKSLL